MSLEEELGYDLLQEGLVEPGKKSQIRTGNAICVVLPFGHTLRSMQWLPTYLGILNLQLLVGNVRGILEI